uniref:putative wall-associated receptor kinase-like 16 n=1 Tax=Erigeron canadensis TaxID=72917 RepID=UPI001CB8DBE0|nr:putative wall-associated receptor kinase-like 16 [Erigeron canadensis]
MYSRILLAAVAVVVVVANAFLGPVSSQQTDCERSCGDIDIPFPFGLEEGCYHSKDQLVTCNRSSAGDPILFLNKSPIVIKNMVPADSTIRVMGDVAHDCNDNSPDQDIRNKAWLSLKNFWISDDNSFFAIGCQTDAYVIGRKKKDQVITGCVTTCDDNSSSGNTNGSCSGNGCCEMTFQKGLGYSKVMVSRNNTIPLKSCSHAFVVEKGGYNFLSTDLADFGKEEMPMLLVWAIGDKTCKEVDKGADDFLCKGDHQGCVEDYDGPGYRCHCKEGYAGNPYIKDNCANIDECKVGTHNCTEKQKCVDKEGDFACIGNELPIVQISIGTSVAGLFLLLLFTWIYLGLKRRKNLILREKFFKQNGGIMLQQRISGDGGSQIQAKLFTVEELEKATNNYDQSKIIGKGGFGTVYKGVLPDDIIVAIKKSKIVDQTQTQVDQFINEVIILSRINHRNVVKLIGCCLETEVPSLVYEFIPNGTLFDHLHGVSKYKAINWDIRLRIAIETAGALSYLHSAASVPIIHRDVKPMNILIDSSYVEKVADFGASRLIPMDQKELATMVQGTLGYLDPEYFHTSQLTEKSDVYSFGVVLVELLTGKKIIDFDRPEKERNLIKHFIAFLEKETLLEVLDEHLQLKEVPHDIILVSRLAQRCLHLKGDERPTMKEVALELEGISASMIDKHPWVKNTSNEEATEYLPNEPSESCEVTDDSNTGPTDFYSIIRKPKITPI